jgi:hypothetical protein
MSSENTQAPQEQTARVHDQGPSPVFAEINVTRAELQNQLNHVGNQDLRLSVPVARD